MIFIYLFIYEWMINWLNERKVFLYSGYSREIFIVGWNGTKGLEKIESNLSESMYCFTKSYNHVYINSALFICHMSWSSVAYSVLLWGVNISIKCQICHCPNEHVVYMNCWRVCSSFILRIVWIWITFPRNP